MTETEILQEILFGFGLGCSIFLAINLFARFSAEDFLEISQLPRQEAIECVEQIAEEGLEDEVKHVVRDHLESLELQGVNVAPYDARTVVHNLFTHNDTFQEVLVFFKDLMRHGAASESYFFILTVLEGLNNPDFIY